MFFPKRHTINSMLKKKCTEKSYDPSGHVQSAGNEAFHYRITTEHTNSSLFHNSYDGVIWETFWDLEAEGCYTLQTLLRSKFVGGSSSKVVPARELKEKSQWKRDAGESLGSPEGIRGHEDYSWVQWPKLGSLKNTNDKRLRLNDIKDEAFQPSEDVLRWKQRQI